MNSGGRNIKSSKGQSLCRDFLIKMAKKKQSALRRPTSKKAGGPMKFKGYDIKWLKGLGEEHPDFKLVSEYEKKFGVIK